MFELQELRTTLAYLTNRKHELVCNLMAEKNFRMFLRNKKEDNKKQTDELKQMETMKNMFDSLNNNIDS